MTDMGIDGDTLYQVIGIVHLLCAHTVFPPWDQTTLLFNVFVVYRMKLAPTIYAAAQSYSSKVSSTCWSSLQQVRSSRAKPPPSRLKTRSGSSSASRSTNMLALVWAAIRCSHWRCGVLHGREAS